MSDARAVRASSTSTAMGCPEGRADEPHARRHLSMFSCRVHADYLEGEPNSGSLLIVVWQFCIPLRPGTVVTDRPKPAAPGSEVPGTSTQLASLRRVGSASDRALGVRSSRLRGQQRAASTSRRTRGEPTGEGRLILALWQLGYQGNVIQIGSRRPAVRV